MRKKAFIYGWFSFPRGGPNANYVQYLALALKQGGYDVVVVCDETQKSLCQYQETMKTFLYKDIVVEFVCLHSGKLLHSIDYRLLRGHYYVKAIKKHAPTQGDVFISYCASATEDEPVLALAKKCGSKTVACLPEYYTSDVFSKEKSYKKYLDYMHRVVPKHDGLFPISEFIREKYPASKAMVLPIMADTNEFQYKNKSDNEKVRLIYSTGKWVKDSLKDMIEGILLLPEEYRLRLELHLTGVKRQQVEHMLSLSGRDMIDNIVIIHPWLQYEQLIDLYCKMDFTLIARPETELFLANFPSKVPEAMTYGIIPIVSRVGDYTNKYLQDGVNSIVFDGCDATACVNAIMRAINTTKEEREILRQNARKCAETCFDYRVWTGEIVNFLDSI